MQISGVVATGKRIGRTLGFPTANILPDEGSVLPEQNGVYAAVLTLEDGRALPCVLNKGRHPTLPEGAATVEAFIFDFAGDLYGQRVRVDFRAFLRPGNALFRQGRTARTDRPRRAERPRLVRRASALALF